ncbi:hypothetical protein [Pseudomonas sp. PS01303]
MLGDAPFDNKQEHEHPNGPQVNELEQRAAEHEGDEQHSSRYTS